MIHLSNTLIYLALFKKKKKGEIYLGPAFSWNFTGIPQLTFDISPTHTNPIPYVEWAHTYNDGVWQYGGSSDGKRSACNAGEPGLIPELGRSPREGNGYPLPYSCLKNSMDRRARWATGHRITKSQTRLSDWHLATQAPLGKAEREKSTSCLRNLEACSAAGGDQPETEVQELSVSQLPLRCQISTCLLFIAPGFSSYLEKHKIFDWPRDSFTYF